ncbi:MAG: hypothetical protein AABX30_03130 [Nanoarchaeota archaeon]
MSKKLDNKLKEEINLEYKQLTLDFENVKKALETKAEGIEVLRGMDLFFYVGKLAGKLEGHPKSILFSNLYCSMYNYFSSFLRGKKLHPLR